MDAKLRAFLWRSPDVRRALRKEVLRFGVGVAAGLALAVSVRWYLGRMPSTEAIWGAALGVAAIFFSWVLAVIRTIRSVLRENSSSTET